ncbi:hypothetical protein [Parasitella parasitica]|uniref:Transcription initiation factor IIA large subunit n=1 Tax=Parasitella parasitica TaxID=35722 RepID=A0A0B7NK97_9FUNG|nr:hypothetical protein [Parasitella parasitica]
MSNAIVSNVYRYVIDDVINQVRGDFEDMGIDDSILQELQRSWETKVARSRVANFGFKEDSYYEDDGNNHGDGNVLTSSHINNNANGQKQNQLPYPPEYSNNNTNLHNNNVPSAASLASLAATTAVSRPSLPQPYGLPPNINNNNNIASRPFSDPSQLVHQYQMMQQQQHKPPHMQQQAQQHQQQQSNTLPELQLPGLPRPNLPQNDGANDELESLTTKQIDQHIEDMIQSSQEQEGEETQISFTASSLSGEPLALDLLPDSVKKLMQEARERAIKAGAIKKRNRIAQLDGEGDTPAATPSSGADPAVTSATTTAALTAATTANDDDINSDLDDSDDDDDDGEGGEEIEHIILCLYDKVTRTKNKWKCILKDGIMLVNGRDYLFHRANGDFEW